MLGDGVLGWSVIHHESRPLVSADLSAEVTGRPWELDVDGDMGEADQFVVANPDPDVYTTILNVEGTTFQIAATGEVTSGESFDYRRRSDCGHTNDHVRRPQQNWVWDGTAGQVCLDACPGQLLGDYDGSGVLDVADLDLQAVAIADGQDPPEFDLTGDGLVNGDDRISWLHDLKVTWVGDADLNGLFDSGDFVAVFVEGLYETGEAAGWAQGDWNADLVFDSGDFVAAFIDGGYEIGEFPGAVQAVPEPSSLVLALLSLAGLVGLARRR